MGTSTKYVRTAPQLNPTEPIVPSLDSEIDVTSPENLGGNLCCSSVIFFGSVRVSNFIEFPPDTKDFDKTVSTLIEAFEKTDLSTTTSESNVTREYFPEKN
jgi:hypothetical protein